LINLIFKQLINHDILINCNQIRIGVKKFLILLIMLGLVACKNPGSQGQITEPQTQNPENKSHKIEAKSDIIDEATWIYGTWQDENSVLTYKEDGSWYGDWITGTQLTGKYELIDDSLFMGFSYRPEPKMKYILFKKTQDSFSLLSYNDREIFHKKRIKDVMY